MATGRSVTDVGADHGGSLLGTQVRWSDARSARAAQTATAPGTVSARRDDT